MENDILSQESSSEVIVEITFFYNMTNTFSFRSFLKSGIQLEI